MSTHGVIRNDAPGSGSATNVNMMLEVVVIPVSNVDHAKEFYERIGWRLDIDRSADEDFRLVQFTPPGSSCSVHFGKNVTSAAPSSAKAFLVVPDIVAARDQLVAAGVEVGEFSGLEAFELWVAGRLTSQLVRIRRSYSPQPRYCLRSN